MMTNETLSTNLSTGRLASVAARGKKSLVADLIAASAVALAWCGAVIAFVVM